VARSWHFIDIYGFIITGLIFIQLLFVSGQWARLVPNTWEILPTAWATFVHYANLHFPPEPNGFYAYNALQQIAYFFVVFIFAPITIVAGAAIWRQTRSTFHSLSDDARLGRVPHRARHACCLDWI
jgi:methionine sulfoxide reductase catalytic subunit